MVKNDGKVSEVVPGSIADDAGLYTGVKIIGVNNYKYSKDRMLDAVKNSKENSGLVLHAFVDDMIKEYHIDYQGTLIYPNLKAIDDKKDRLTEILSPLREIEEKEKEE